MTLLNPNGNIAALMNIIAHLKAHRKALDDLMEDYKFTSTTVVADWTNPPIGMDAPTAQGMLNAVADAYGEWLIHNNGTDPNHPINPVYPYGASQNALIGGT